MSRAGSCEPAGGDPGARAAVGRPGRRGRAARLRLVAPADRHPPLVGAVSVFLQRGDDARQAFALAKEFHGQGAAVVRVKGLGQRAFYAPAVGAIYVLEDSETLLLVQGVYPTGSTVDVARSPAGAGGARGPSRTPRLTRPKRRRHGERARRSTTSLTSSSTTSALATGAD